MSKLLNRIIYLPLVASIIIIILLTNFLMDDWGQLGGGLTYRQQVSDWTDLWAFRPISWVTIPGLVHALRDSYVLLSTVHLALISYSYIEISNWRIFAFSKRQKLLTRYLLFSPAIASSLFFSPINQLSASLSLLFFGLALQVERRNLKPAFKNILIPTLFVLSLFSYEITAPLILTYYLMNSRRERKGYLILQAMFVFVTIVSWQKLIAPNLFSSDFSRIRAINPGAGISLFFSTFISFPFSLLTSLFDSGRLLLILFLSVLIFLYSRNLSSSVNAPNHKFVSFVLFIGIASSSLLFIFAGAFSQINGYQNRGMSGVWILISLLLATRYEQCGNLGRYLIILVVSTNFFVFSGKVVESIEASKAREKVVSQVSEFFAASGDIAPVVFLELPCVMPAGGYKTEVFCTTWDALGAMKASGLRISNVSPIGDPSFLGNWESKDIPAGSLNFKFGNNFELEEISEAGLDDPKFRIELLEAGRRQLFEVENRKQSCKDLAKTLVDNDFQFDWAEVVRCASDPFT